jgi:hypothetical protein
MKVTATHDEAVYVAVEKFEDMLADFTCSPSKYDNTSTLIFTYDFQNLIAIGTARSVVLGDSPEASSQLVVQGRPINTELRKKLRRRSNLQGYAGLVKRDIDEPGQWESDFAEFGAFDAREDILTFE